MSPLQFRCAMALNRGAPGGLAFDAGLRHASRPLAVLCDGANGTPHGGPLAQAACQHIMAALEAGVCLTPQVLDDLSATLERQFPDSGCTLLAYEANDRGLRITGVGDSFAELFAHRQGQWQPEDQLGRHQDANGHPTQLVGADVPISPHLCERSACTGVACWAAFLMTDGAGAYLSTADLREALLPIGEQTPSDHDLQFCAESLAELAVSRGSHDDASVLMIWVRQA
ncbi:MAG: protein phosphatase 2C domain-containing protein [Proteobacteria bacterium]|nr:protein phosphatase 2C domain-containing protein [Pseudomonadota bacterium]